ncbi:MAG TPA: HPr kinase/phosphatase C-terminal domain-containing protein [Hyphomicrobiales bacterium]|nr:HPr kinase/phosphatase C-terminal domain-containing protein [Hyphomicrobiales bacterium]
MDTIHASCVVVGDAGVLIRGASGAGKSRLVRELIARGAALGRFVSLVADDRVALAATGGRLIARPHPRLAGLVEVRGLGLAELSYEAAAVVRLLVELVAADDMPRMPRSAEGTARLQGIVVPRLFAADAAAAAVIVVQLLAKPGSPLAFATQRANHARSLTPAAGTDDLAGGRED